MNIALHRVLLLTTAPLVLSACASGAGAHLERCGLSFCSAGQTCVANTCVEVPPNDGGGGGCQSDADCSAGRCLVETGACVACLAEADCPVGTCNQSHACVPLPDGCGSAEQVDLSLGPVHLAGNLARAADDTHASCATSLQGPDLVYQLTVPQQGRLTAKVVSDGSFRPVVELRKACSGGGTPLACNHPTASLSTTAAVQVDPVLPGTYYLWVDSDDGAAGAFTLDVSLENPPPTDSCSVPTYVHLMDTPLTLTGTTVGLTDDTAGTCGGQGAPDGVFGVRVDTPMQVRFDVASSTTGFAPVLYVRQACDDARPRSQVACLSGPGESFTLPVFGPGLLYLFVDGQSDGHLVNAGNFTVTLTPSAPAGPPTNDSCGLAQTLALPTTGAGMVSVESDTTAAADDATGCAGAGGGDLVYQFHLDEPRLVQVTVTPLLGANYLPVVYLRPGGQCQSEDSKNQYGCRSALDYGEPVTSVVPSLPAGDWFLWVDGFNSSGPFNLSVEIGDPPPVPGNDSCASPAPLSLSTGYGTVYGTTLGAGDDVSDFSCTEPSGVASPDVVYGFSLGAPAFVGLDLNAAAGSSLLPVVELRTGTLGSPNSCTDSTDSSALVGCNWGDPAVPNRAVYSAGTLQAGEYFIWVEGDQASQGDFSLRVVLGTPGVAPSNDGCQALASPLATGSTVMGDTRFAHADALDPGLDGTPTDFGPDVVYPVNVTSSSLTVTVTPDPVNGTLLRPALALRTACADPSTTAWVAAGGDYGTPASFTFTQLTPGTYYLWVGGVRQSSGAFTLELR